MPIVQTPKKFLTDFVKEAETAKKRIYLQSMLFERGEILQTLEPVLIKKAKEGIDVRVNADWVSQKYVEDNPHLLPSIRKRQKIYDQTVHKETNALIARWKKAGIIFTFTNVPPTLASLLTIAGRNHIKMYLIDDTTSWIGGMNLFDHALTLIDIMVKFEDPHLVENLIKQFFRVNYQRPKKNYRVAYSSHNTLLIDAGIRGKSLIYNEALKMISQSTSTITFASQFLPDGQLLKSLLQAEKRGIKIIIITSNKDNKVFNKFPYNIPYFYLQKKLQRKKNIVLMHRERRVHAKLLIVDKTTALFGSHNLTRIGDLLGTDEIAIQTKDEHLIKELQRFINNTQA